MERACDYCGQTYTAKRSTSRYCSNSHRAMASQKGVSRPATVAAVVPVRPAISGVEDATRAELAAAGRLDSAAGQQALALAVLIDSPPPMTWSSVSGWCKEHRAAMADALKSAAPAASSLDELKARRSAKRGA